MKLEEIIGVLNNKVIALETAKSVAYGHGDLVEYARLESEIAETKATLGALIE
jgi:hypothetical protein